MGKASLIIGGMVPLPLGKSIVSLTYNNNGSEPMGIEKYALFLLRFSLGICLLTNTITFCVRQEALQENEAVLQPVLGNHDDHQKHLKEAALASKNTGAILHWGTCSDKRAVHAKVYYRNARTHQTDQSLSSSHAAYLSYISHKNCAEFT